jgi:hypothetical protein
MGGYRIFAKQAYDFGSESRVGIYKLFEGINLNHPDCRFQIGHSGVMKNIIPVK